MKEQHLPVKILNGVGCRTHVGCPSLSQQQDTVNHRKKNEKRTFNIALYKNTLKNITKWFKVSFRLITAMFPPKLLCF